jgi:hypothetical protein
MLSGKRLVEYKKTLRVGEYAETRCADVISALPFCSGIYSPTIEQDQKDKIDLLVYLEQVAFQLVLSVQVKHSPIKAKDFAANHWSSEFSQWQKAQGPIVLSGDPYKVSNERILAFFILQLSLLLNIDEESKTTHDLLKACDVYLQLLSTEIAHSILGEILCLLDASFLRTDLMRWGFAVSH